MCVCVFVCVCVCVCVWADMVFTCFSAEIAWCIAVCANNDDEYYADEFAWLYVCVRVCVCECVITAEPRWNVTNDII